MEGYSSPASIIAHQAAIRLESTISTLEGGLRGVGRGAAREEVRMEIEGVGEMAGARRLEAQVASMVLN